MLVPHTTGKARSVTVFVTGRRAEDFANECDKSLEREMVMLFSPGSPGGKTSVQNRGKHTRRRISASHKAEFSQLGAALPPLSPAQNMRCVASDETYLFSLHFPQVDLAHTCLGSPRSGRGLTLGAVERDLSGGKRR